MIKWNDYFGAVLFHERTRGFAKITVTDYIKYVWKVKVIIKYVSTLMMNYNA